MNNRTDRIILTGFRATGKSTVGRELADRLGYGFVDTDKILVERFGCSIARYVREHDWPAFRAQEAGLLVELSDRTEIVISTGGGAVINETAWATMRKHSLVIWLRADADTIRSRLARDAATSGQRPSLTGRDAFAEVDLVLREREPLYRKSSDVALDTEAVGPQELVQQILRLLENKNERISRQETQCQEIVTAPSSG